MAITEPGRYELNSTIRTGGNSRCIAIAADNVVLEGNGHTIAGARTSSNGNPAVAIGTTNGAHSNVTVENLTVAGSAIALNSENDTDVNVRNVTVRGGASGWIGSLRTRNDSHVTVSDSSFVDTNIAIHADGSGFVIRNDTFSNNSRDVDARSTHGLVVSNSDLGDGGVYLSSTTNSTIVGNTEHSGGAYPVATSGDTGVEIRGNDFKGEVYVHAGTSDVTIDNNTISARPAGLSFGGVQVGSSENVSITNNTITGLDRSAGVYLAGDEGAISVTNNVIESNENGIKVGRMYGPVTIRGNVIRDNAKAGVHVYGQKSCWAPNKTATVAYTDIHRNVISGNGVGVTSGDDTHVLNATENYWGASGGPSSDRSVALEDPVTGALANGSGNSVSADPSKGGVSNVHFDDWLTSPPANATS